MANNSDSVLSNMYLNSSSEEIINTMKARNMIATQRVCSGTAKKTHPPKDMSFKKRVDTDDGFCWRCNRCGTRKSIRAGSFFEQCRAPLAILFKLIIHWVVQTKYTAIGSFLGTTRQSIGEFYQRIRFVVITEFIKSDLKLGGTGVIVEIDESLFAKVCL